jgi:chromosome segregation ATPase
MATTKKSASKKAAPQVQPRKRQPAPRKPVINKDYVNSLQNANSDLTEKNEALKKDISELVECLNTTQKTLEAERKVVNEQPHKPCPKCQILSILENADLSESQVNSVMRDVNNEIQESRLRRLNRFNDEAEFAKDKAKAFSDDCLSNEPYN